MKSSVYHNDSGGNIGQVDNERENWVTKESQHNNGMNQEAHQTDEKEEEAIFVWMTQNFISTPKVIDAQQSQRYKH